MMAILVNLLISVLAVVVVIGILSLIIWGFMKAMEGIVENSYWRMIVWGVGVVLFIAVAAMLRYMALVNIVAEGVKSVL